MSGQDTTFGIRMTGDGSQLVAESDRVTKAQAGIAEQVQKTTSATKDAGDESKRFVDRLKEQADTLGKNRSEVERYRAAHMELTDVQKQSVSTSLAEIDAFDKKEKAHASVRSGLMLLTTAVLTYATATAFAVNGIIEERAQLHNLSQSIALSTESLSAYRYQTSLVGVSTDGFGMSMKILSKNIAEAQSGVGSGAEVFKLLGSDILQAAKQGASIEQLLPQISDRFAQFADGPNKTALALQLFGRAGEQMIPMLNQGSEGFRAAAREAAEFSRIVGTEAARAADEFESNMVRVNAILGGTKQQLADQVIPEVNKLTEAFIRGTREGGKWRGLVELGKEAFTPHPTAEQNQATAAQFDAQIAALQAQGVVPGSASLRGQQLQNLMQGRSNIDLVAATSKRATDDMFAFSGDFGGKQQAPVLSPDFDRLKNQAVETSKIYDLQLGSTEKLTDQTRQLVQLQQAQASGLIKLNPEQYKEVEALFKVNAGKAQLIANRERDIELNKEQVAQATELLNVQAQQDAAYVAFSHSGDERLRQLETETQLTASETERSKQLSAVTTNKFQQIQQETSLTALNNAARDKANEYRRIELELEKALLTLGDQEGEQADKRRRALNDEAAAQKAAIGAAIDKKAATQQAHDAAEATRKEWQSETDNIQRALTQGIVNGIMNGFASGKKPIDIFIETMKGAFAAAILTPIISPIMAPIAGAMTGVGQGIAASIFGGAAGGAGGGAGGAAAGLGMAGLFGQTGADFGNFFGSIGSTTEAGGTFGMMDALGGFAMSNPWTAAAVVGGGLLLGDSLFGGGGHQKNSQIMLQGGPGSYSIGQADVPGSEANVPYYDQFNARLNDPKQFDQATLAQFSGQWIQGGAGEGRESMVAKLLQVLEPAHQAALQVAQQQLAVQQQLLAKQDELVAKEGQIAAGLSSQLGITTLEAAANSLAVSDTLAPSDRLAAARGQLDASFSSAMGGDLTAVQNFPQVLQQALTIGRDTFASGPEFQSIFKDGNVMLQDLLQHQRDVQAELTKDIPVSIIESGQNTVAALRAGFESLKTELQGVQTQLRQLAAAA